MLHQRFNYHTAASVVYSHLFWATVLAAFCTGCSSKAESKKIELVTAAKPAATVNVFDNFMAAAADPADGFDRPVASGLRVSVSFEDQKGGIHLGEDWSLPGREQFTVGQTVYAIGNGRVIFAGPRGKTLLNTIVIEHTYYENNQKLTLYSVYSGLGDFKVKEGDVVKRHQPISTIYNSDENSNGPHLHFELTWDKELSRDASTNEDRAWVEQHYLSPSKFINEHKTLFVPQRESTLVLVDQSSYKMRIYNSGRLQGEYDVSFGQSEGQKRTQGDNKTPKGMYFVIQKHRGEFPGPYGGYFGGHWMKINYPNKYDAEWGQSQGVIDAKQAAIITANWEKRAATLESTGLGGGIGFHGWIREWNNQGPRHLSWG